MALFQLLSLRETSWQQIIKIVPQLWLALKGMCFLEAFHKHDSLNKSEIELYLHH
jgi:hypothetical protein